MVNLQVSWYWLNRTQPAVCWTRCWTASILPVW